jgi:hypothetical protein
MMMTPQQERLFELACLWFERSRVAFQHGDKLGHRVASLAHSMIYAAYKETMKGQGND